MKDNSFDRRIALTIKCLRLGLGEKQIIYAKALQMSASNYSKLENSHKQFKISELKILSQHLKISIGNICTLSEIVGKYENLADMYGQVLYAYLGMKTQKQSLNHLTELKSIYKN